MKKTGFNGYFYDFNVDYDAITVDDISEIHKYLMKKNDIKMFGRIKKAFFARLTILSSVNLLNAFRLSAAPLTVTPLRCISMNNQEYKVRPKFVNVKSNEPVFILLVLKQVNTVVVVTTSMIHMQKYVFLMLLKT